MRPDSGQEWTLSLPDWAGDQQLGSCAWFCDFAGPGPLDPQPLSISAAVRRHGKNNRKKNGDEFALNARFTALQLECVNKFNAKRSASKRPNPARPAFFGPRTNSCTATPLGERWIENTAGELHSEAVSCMLPAGAELQNGNPG